MNQYQIKNALDKVDGYFNPSPTKAGGNAAEFERAKNECLANLLEQVEHVKAVTPAQMASYKKISI